MNIMYMAKPIRPDSTLEEHKVSNKFYFFLDFITKKGYLT